MVTSVAIVASGVVSVILAITAFTAVGKWNSLIEDIKDQSEYVDLEIDLGYSWYLMLFSGIIGVTITVMSVFIFCGSRNKSHDDALLNNKM